MALGGATALAGGAQTPIVDAHVHLWDDTHLGIPWIDANAVLNRPYLPADYTEHTAGTGTAALVYVEVAVATPSRRWSRTGYWHGRTWTRGSRVW